MEGDQDSVRLVWMSKDKNEVHVPALRFYSYRQAEEMGFDLNKLRLQNIGPIMEPEKFAIVVELICGKKQVGTPMVVEVSKYVMVDYQRGYRRYLKPFLQKNSNAIDILSIANDFYLGGTLRKTLLPTPAEVVSPSYSQDKLWTLTWAFAVSKGWQKMKLKHDSNLEMFWVGNEIANHVVGREEFVKAFHASCDLSAEPEGEVVVQVGESRASAAEKPQEYSFKELWEICKVRHKAYYDNMYVLPAGRRFDMKKEVIAYWEHHGLIESVRKDVYIILSPSFPVAAVTPVESSNGNQLYSFKNLWRMCTNEHGAEYRGGMYKIPGLPPLGHEKELIQYWKDQKIIEPSDEKHYYKITSKYFPYDRRRSKSIVDVASDSSDSYESSAVSSAEEMVEEEIKSNASAESEKLYNFKGLLALCKADHGATTKPNRGLGNGYHYILPNLDPFDGEFALLNYWLENRVIEEIAKHNYAIIAETFPYAAQISAPIEGVKNVPTPPPRRRSMSKKLRASWEDLWKTLFAEGWRQSSTGEYLRPKSDEFQAGNVYIDRFPSEEDVMLYIQQRDASVVDQMRKVSLSESASARKKAVSAKKSKSSKDKMKKRRRTIGEALKVDTSSRRKSSDDLTTARKTLAVIWPELREMGYKKENPRGNDIHYYFMKPDVTLRTGVRGVDYFHGPVDFMEHVNTLNLLSLQAPPSVKKPTVCTPPPAKRAKKKATPMSAVSEAVSIDVEPLSMEQQIFSCKPLLYKMGYQCRQPFDPLKTEYVWLKPGVTVADAKKNNDYFETPQEFYKYLETCDLTPFAVFLVEQNWSFEVCVHHIMPLLKIQGNSERRIQRQMEKVSGKLHHKLSDLLRVGLPMFDKEENNSMSKIEEEIEETQVLTEITQEFTEAIEETQPVEAEAETQVIEEMETQEMETQEMEEETQEMETETIGEINRELTFESQESELDRLTRCLGSSYVPSEYECRKEEMEKIRSFFSTAIRDTKKNGLYLYGRPGTGKSAVMNRMRDDLTAMLRTEYTGSLKIATINAMSVLRLQKLFPLLAKEFLDEESDDPMVCFHMLKQGIDNTKFVLILDEMDALMNKSEHLADMYSLMEWVNQPDSNLILVGIANTVDETEKQLERLALKYTFEMLVFKPYNHEQLGQILRQRIQDSPYFDRLAIEIGARKVASNTGDVRDALGLCSRALQVAYSRSSTKPYVTMRDMVDQCNAKFRPPVLKTTTQLSRPSKLILYATLQLENCDPAIVKACDLFNVYDDTCRKLLVMSGGHNTYVGSLKELVQVAVVKAKGDVGTETGWTKTLQFIPMRSEIKTFLKSDGFFNRLLK